MLINCEGALRRKIDEASRVLIQDQAKAIILGTTKDFLSSMKSVCSRSFTIHGWKLMDFRFDFVSFDCRRILSREKIGRKLKIIH